MREDMSAAAKDGPRLRLQGIVETAEGVTPGEWTDIETVSSITATNFLQYTRPYNDRHYRYVRVLCSGGARLVLDDGAQVRARLVVAADSPPLPSQPSELQVAEVQAL
jgi:hypothetical protein